MSNTPDTITTPPQINTKKFALILMFIIALTLFLPGLALVLFIGMLPTFGAFISDPTRNNTQSFCVGICNFTGLGPLVKDLFDHSFNLSYAYTLIHNDINLLTILCSAAIGWAIFFIVPTVTVAFYRNRDRTALINMVRRYEQLKKTWGNSIPDSPSVESIRNKNK